MAINLFIALILLAILLGANVFNKHVFFNMAIFFDCTAIIWLVTRLKYEGYEWIVYSLLFLIVYEFIAMSKGKTK